MNIYFIIDWYLNKLEDHKFKTVWERNYMGRKPIFWSFVFYLAVLFSFTGTASENIGWFFGFIFFFGFGGLFAVYMLFQYLKFMSRHSVRYMNVTNVVPNSDTFSKDNVVN